MASHSLFGEKAAPTGRSVGGSSASRSRVEMERCEATSQTRVKPSLRSTEMSRWPSGENNGEFGQGLCSRSVMTARLGSGSQTLIVGSPELEMSDHASGANAAENTAP